MSREYVIHIRDPIHGTLPLNGAELSLVDHPIFQRLRNIKQLGFADLAFPGATHSRYSHSLGAMAVATRIFDRVFQTLSLPERVHQRFRQAVRLAMLLHDVGHAPLSHTTEVCMPPVGELGLGLFAGDDVSRLATHEDYTLKIVLDSELALSMQSLFAQLGILPHDVAELILGSLLPQQSTRFRYSGIDYAPVLRQIVSSEVDADRMDYLQRDSFYSGVNYGKFDADWLIDNVVPVEKDRAIYLGIRARAIFSFEDFLLSRYHMFASVYLHHTPVIFEKMLQRYFEECPGAFTLPSDIGAYTAIDDLDLWMNLRKSDNVWARRVVDRKPFFLLDERDLNLALESNLAVDQVALVEELKSAGIDVIATRSKSTLSKYFDASNKNESKIPIYVQDNTGRTSLLEETTPLYARYDSPATLARIFVEPSQRERAQKVLQNHLKKRDIPAREQTKTVQKKTSRRSSLDAYKASASQSVATDFRALEPRAQTSSQAKKSALGLEDDSLIRMKAEQNDNDKI
ncbi:MAG: HD domain-containing protein [Deltaproteobacteria bacterium]|nr:HD domain-containing protein [Deltaproteobacteria bacterium]